MKLVLRRSPYFQHVSTHVHAFVVCSVALALLCILAAIPADASAESTTASLDTSTIISLTNANRAAHNQQAVVEVPLLDIAAQKKANDMMALGYFSHFGPDGQSPWHWFTSVGYLYTRAGENLAMDFDTAQSVEYAWMSSPSHRDNILNSSYTKTGVGIAHGIYQGVATTFVVQFFATPTKTSVPKISKVARKISVSGAIASKL